MSVVARLSCHAVEHTTFGTTVRLQPVVPADDPHDAEIKRFFAATPAGTVKLASEKGRVPLDADPGDQFYLYLDPDEGEGDYPVTVSSITLNGYATQTKLSAERTNTPPWQACEMEFAIRNEAAAEQFQIGSKFFAHFEKIS